MPPRSSATRRTRFFELSTALTGDDGLPENLAAPYLKRVDKAHPGQVDALLHAFDAGRQNHPDVEGVIRDHIVTQDALWVVARDVICVWLTSRLPSVDAVSPEVVPPEQYFQGRIWNTIRAHPQGLSGGYFGHWHYEPEA
jgi:hypothetical protein